jgi:DNA end-binding protein Ku
LNERNKKSWLPKLRTRPQGYARLASHIVKTKAGHFDTDKFEDQYEDALKELLKKKQEGKPIERPERPKPTNVVNLMDALRQSIEASGAATSTKAKARAASPRSSSEKAEHPKPKRTRRSG